MTSRDFEFHDVLTIALGRPRLDSVTESEERIIGGRLDHNIKRARIASLTTGPHPAGVQTSRQHDSLNHSVIYVRLDDDSVARFSMENGITTKKGTSALGKLTMKFQKFYSSQKEVMSLSRPWKFEVILTLRYLVILAYIAKVDQFLMTKELTGCRCFG